MPKKMSQKKYAYVAHKMSESRHREIDMHLRDLDIIPIYPEDLNGNFEKKDVDPVARKLAAKKIFKDNIDAIRRSDFVFAFTDDWDPGVMFEIGYAKALQKYIVTCSFAGYGSNIMIQEAAWMHFSTLDDLKKWLIDQKVC